jgi:excinuclease ABC subunit C
MKEHAGKTEFERAAQLRDQVWAVEKTLTKQTVVSTELIDQDVIGLHRQDDVVEVVVLFMRLGKLLGRRTFSLKEQEVPDADVVRDFVMRYYDLGTFIPDEVVVPVPFDDMEVVAETLGEQRGRKVQLLAPQRAARAKLVALAEKNAQASFAARLDKRADVQLALEKLQKRLGLRRFPHRIECFDIAHIQGVATVASMVVFLDGEPAKKEYRSFKVKTVTNDDFAAMYEVLSRRFRRSREGKAGWAEPDLLVVDGGKGQLSTALAALRDLGIEITAEKGFDVVSLAKERTDAGGTDQPDRVYLRNVKDPQQLRSNSTELFMLARIRDEAHRFANTYHQNRRSKALIRSALDDVPGIGTTRKKQLLRHFGSLKAIKDATETELAAAPGMTRAAAASLFAFFHEPA